MAASKQSKAAEATNAARKASLDDLIAKRPLQKSVTIFSGDEPLEIVVRSIGRKAYADLVDKFTSVESGPKIDPTTGEPELDDKGEPVLEDQEKLDDQEFFPALIAASSAEPEIPIDVVKQFADEWNATEFDELAMAAWEVNTQHKVNTQGNA